jgi:dynein assembly factor 1
MVEMTKDALKQICKDLKLYNTPGINDKLYCHYKGFRKIENLEEYTNLKVIWLEGNGFNKIEGLEYCTQIRTLYIQENLISKIENLDALKDLDTLQMSQNSVSRIENLSHAQSLQTLQLKSNNLKTADDIAHILECPSISCLDIQHNKIDDPGVVEILEQMPNLRVLYLQGNDVIKKIKWYRKAMINKCKSLTYLDDRPVFPDERLRAVAWCKGWEEGGTVEAAREAERAELDRQRAEKKQKEIDNYRAFDDMVRRAREDGAAEKKLREELPREFINIFSGEVIMQQDEVNIFTGEAIVPARESDLVRDSRRGRWEHVVGAGAEAEPEHTDADLTVEERAHREEVREACKSVGDGTFTREQAESQRALKAQQQQQQQAKAQAAAAAGGGGGGGDGGLFNQSFMNSCAVTEAGNDTNKSSSGSNSNRSGNNASSPASSPEPAAEPVFFNQTDQQVMEKINSTSANIRKNNNGGDCTVTQQEAGLTEVEVGNFTNMEELD